MSSFFDAFEPGVHPDQYDLRSLFTFDDSFWNSKEAPVRSGTSNTGFGIDHLHSTISSFSSDGVSISWIKQTIKPHNPSESSTDTDVQPVESSESNQSSSSSNNQSNYQPKSHLTTEEWVKSEDKKRLQAHLSENLESVGVRLSDFIGVFAFDGNRRNVGVGTFHPWSSYVEDDNPMFNPPPVLNSSTGRLMKDRGIAINFSNAEWSVKRGTIGSRRVLRNVESAYKRNRIGVPDIFKCPKKVVGVSNTLANAFFTHIFTTTSSSSATWLQESSSYWSNRKFRNNRMKQHTKKLKWWHHVRDKVYKTVAARFPNIHRQDGTKSRILFIIGDGSFMHNSRGFITVPSGMTMLKELRKLGESVYFIDEFRTSMCCSCCGHPLKQPVKRPSIKKTKHWALKQCFTPECQNKLWNRDFNACRNFHAIVRALLSGRDRPAYLQRQLRPAPVDMITPDSSPYTPAKRVLSQTEDNDAPEFVLKNSLRSGKKY